jgi:hypothetical protein
MTDATREARCGRLINWVFQRSCRDGRCDGTGSRLAAFIQASRPDVGTAMTQEGMEGLIAQAIRKRCGGVQGRVGTKSYPERHLLQEVMQIYRYD